MSENEEVKEVVVVSNSLLAVWESVKTDFAALEEFVVKNAKGNKSAGNSLRKGALALAKRFRDLKNASLEFTKGLPKKAKPTVAKKPTKTVATPVAATPQKETKKKK